MLRVILVDDEKPALDLMERMFSKRKDVEIVGKFLKPSEVLLNVEKLKPDVVYLDIDMPGTNGIELAMQIAEINDQVAFVFVTAYDRFALNAFNVNTLDYILKPVVEEKLDRSINRVYKLKGIGKSKHKTESNSIDIRMFGGFEVKIGSQMPIRWTTAKAEELFAYLLLNDCSVSKWVLMDRLWPNTETHKAEQSLYTTIFRLKQSFKENNLGFEIQAVKKTYRLISLTELHWDVKELLNSLSFDDEGSMQRAMKIYKGDLLAGKDYFWCYQMRVEMLAIYQKLALKLFYYYFQEKRYREGLDVVESVLRHTPLNDEFMEKLESLLDTKLDKRIVRRISAIIEKVTMEELIYKHDLDSN
ncbi:MULTISPECIES: response regulator [Desulfitobacterium]|uniref:Stage 0 sporulation protein A homolog n=1 Tax=Desulfitobacterium dehalogenans (strain ATCC 51507 / DSM 9161 / JW/IU-DC1) TaxID=756499 RepID=I4ADA7_DESDJ|nr:MULTISPECIES: response regulator [Desulfitobacterium]AFM01942.1 response regulator containing CheY-like receiver and SARP domains [Desulfitobacterium dehalogenans ATCC 51507]